MFPGFRSCFPAFFLPARQGCRVRRQLAVTLAALLNFTGYGTLHAGDVTSTALAPAPCDARFEFAYETAFNFGVNNPNNYVTNPHFLSLRWQPRHTESFFHTRILFYQQFEMAAALVPFWHGPEQHYFGLGFGTRLNYTTAGSRWSVFVDGKCYVGAIDSSGPPYGQGQDLTFSPTVSGGVAYRVAQRQRVSLSLLYQHYSNAGFSEPERKNVGLNTLGPMFEWNVSF